MKSRTEYETTICERLKQREHIPFKAVSEASWAPMVADCHNNVSRWVLEHPGSQAVRGWVTYANFGNHIGLTAHSVVRDAGGQLIDITPLENESYRAGMQFIPHVGDEETFFAMKEINLYMNCPSEAL